MASRFPAYLLTAAAALAACHSPAPAVTTPSGGTRAVSPVAEFWNGATIYFLLTDRFDNGDPSNDTPVGRKHDGSVLRSFEGGDLAGVRQRIEQGYFDSLGVDAIWLTPFVEQIHGAVDEGTGKTYAFHGYWTRDWTAVDPNLGSKSDLKAMIDAAHRHHIRVLMDAVINHTGPMTPVDPAWPADWVRSSPNCSYRDYATTVSCNLVATLPDVLTESDAPVALPDALLAKWASEGRKEQELASLDAFFRRTGYPRAPKYYLIKWLTDWVREYGIDGYRVDTAKHFEASVSATLKHEASAALADWRAAHPGQGVDQRPFYMVGEVYGFEPGDDRAYNYGDREVDFYANGYDGLINFGFKRDVAGSLDALDRRYSAILHGGSLNGVTVLNYLSSHDDGGPYDRERKDPFGAAERLLLAPGTAQIYYGDETARPLQVAGAEGDANLRSFMNWKDLTPGSIDQQVLAHWRRIGLFRHRHPSVGAGLHTTLETAPFLFSRVLDGDRVLVGLDLPAGRKSISVHGVFPTGATLVDEYSGSRATVAHDSITFDTPTHLLLLGATR